MNGLTNMLSILGFTIVPMAIIGFVVFRIFAGLGKQSQETQALLATGIPAQGRITNLQMGGGTITVMGHRHLMLSLQIEVHPPNAAPYYTQIQQTISELMLGSVQPGTIVQLRVDPTNPMRVAIAATAMQGAAPGGMYPGAPAAMTPFAPPDIAGASRRSMPFIIGMILITTVPVMAIMLYVFVDWGGIFHTAGTPEGGWCAGAARCCREISGASPACANYDNGLMPSEGCKMTFQSYQSSARSMGKVCQ